MPGPPQVPHTPLLQVPASGVQAVPLATQTPEAQQPPSRQALPAQQAWPTAPQLCPVLLLPASTPPLLTVLVPDDPAVLEPPALVL